MHEGVPELCSKVHKSLPWFLSLQLPALDERKLKVCAQGPHSPSLSLINIHRTEKMGGAGPEGEESWILES